MVKVQKIHKSYRLVYLHKYIKPNYEETNIYLLVEQLDNSIKNSWIKYLGSNESNSSLLPTTKPIEYYTDKSNIIQTLTLKLNIKTNIILVILKHLDILDILKYKI